MTTPTRQTTVDITAGPRAVIHTAADIIFRVSRTMLGEDRVPTAQGNAWEAMVADRERARQRAELQSWLVQADGAGARAARVG